MLKKGTSGNKNLLFSLLVPKGLTLNSQFVAAVGA